jgi:multidrug efflux pump subunit AcrB
MKAITTNKWVLLLVVFLVLTNLALVFFAFTSSKKSAKPQENNFRKQIGLTAQQEKEFDERKAVFFKVMKPRWEEVNQLKDSLYQHLGDENVSDSMIDYYTSKWTEINKQNDMMLFKHFKDLRKLWTDSQHNAYDSAVNKMVTRRRK